MKKVYIGIGHGGSDPGACSGSLRESDLNLALGFLIKAELDGYVETKISRTSDVTFNTASKISDANAWGADAVVDVHHNAYNGTASGFEIYRSQAADGSAALAQAINDAIVATGRKSRGVKTNVQNGVDYYGIIRQTNATASLIEYGFLDNTADAALITDPACQRAWAKATAQGILAYLGIDGSGGRDTSALTPICGQAEATVEQLRAFLQERNPDAPDYAAIYLEEGAAEGIRGDIAFVQSCMETGYWRFGGDVKPEQNNFCGLGATGGGEPGCSFATPREGIRAQVQHLKAYASTDALNQECIDPRFKYVQRGAAPYVEWLGIPDNPQGKGWAAAQGYGEKVLALMEDVMKKPTGAQDDALEALRVENQRLKNIILKVAETVAEA